MALRRVLSNELNCQQTHDQENPNECDGAPKLVELKWVQVLIAQFRSYIREEVEEAVKRVILPHLPSLQIHALPSTSRLMPHEAELSATRSLQLHFVGNFPDSFLTLNNIHDDESAPLKVELCDSSGSRVELGPESRAKIKFVALDGDFEVEERNHWTDEELKEYIVQQRKGKRPLLVGDCEVFMSNGEAIISNVSFTDNSKWMRSGNFRLGAQVVKGLPPGVAVRPAVSQAFKVKERRLQSYQKHKTPSLEDEVWRLENIAKNGPIRLRLADAKIYTVQDFLQLYHTDAKVLRNILNVSEKKWAEIVKNAESCSLSAECYVYYDDAANVKLLLDCVFNILSVTFNGQNSLPYAVLVDSLKDFVGRLRCNAYEKRSELPKTCAPTNQNQIMLQAEPYCPSVIQHMNVQYFDASTADQGEQAAQMNTISPADLMCYVSSHEDASQTEPIGATLDSFPDEFITELLDFVDSIPILEQRDNICEASADESVSSKLKAVCYVTKAAILFMISIQQDPTVPLRKKQKLG